MFTYVQFQILIAFKNSLKTQKCLAVLNCYFVASGFVLTMMSIKTELTSNMLVETPVFLLWLSTYASLRKTNQPARELCWVTLICGFTFTFFLTTELILCYQRKIPFVNFCFFETEAVRGMYCLGREGSSRWIRSFDISFKNWMCLHGLWKIWDSSGLFRRKLICELFCVCHRNASFLNQQSQQNFVLICTHPSFLSQKCNFPSEQCPYRCLSRNL